MTWPFRFKVKRAGRSASGSVESGTQRGPLRRLGEQSMLAGVRAANGRKRRARAAAGSGTPCDQSIENRDGALEAQAGQLQSDDLQGERAGHGTGTPGACRCSVAPMAEQPAQVDDVADLARDAKRPHPGCRLRPCRRRSRGPGPPSGPPPSTASQPGLCHRAHPPVAAIDPRLSGWPPR